MLKHIATAGREPLVIEAPVRGPFRQGILSLFTSFRRIYTLLALKKYYYDYYHLVLTFLEPYKDLLNVRSVYIPLKLVNNDNVPY